MNSVYGVNQKKKRTLIDDQKYEYNFEKIKNGTEFWRCQKFKKGCKGRAISRPSTNRLQNEPKHDHSNNLVCKMARATEMAAIINICIEHSAEVLKKCAGWSVDGTFKTAPHPFVQAR